MPQPQIRIRLVTEKDAADVYEYASHELIAATCNVLHPYPKDGAKVFIREALQRSARGEAFVFAILAAGKFVGLISINCVIDPERSISIDFGIAVPFWNNGYASAAVKEGILFVKNELKAKWIQSACLRENIASKRVMEKNGFRKVGEKLYDGPRMDRFRNRLLDVYRLGL
jgi:ribosomal-protein-alanine N-acetyltransferase